MDFKNAQELLELCHTNNLPVSAIMKKRECILGGTTEKAIYDQMNHSLQIMRDSVTSPIQSPKKSIGGLIGGEAQLVNQHRIGGNSICGPVLSKAIAYSMAVLETNTTMGLIVAAPTAGSSGVIPGLLLALQEEYQLEDKEIIDALFNASAIGYLAMRNATVAGAVGGCQAEVGVACLSHCGANGRHSGSVSPRCNICSYEFPRACM